MAAVQDTKPTELDDMWAAISDEARAQMGPYATSTSIETMMILGSVERDRIFYLPTDRRGLSRKKALAEHQTRERERSRQWSSDTRPDVVKLRNIVFDTVNSEKWWLTTFDMVKCRIEAESESSPAEVRREYATAVHQLCRFMLAYYRVLLTDYETRDRSAKTHHTWTVVEKAVEKSGILSSLARYRMYAEFTPTQDADLAAIHTVFGIASKVAEVEEQFMTASGSVGGPGQGWTWRQGAANVVKAVAVAMVLAGTVPFLTRNSAN